MNRAEMRRMKREQEKAHTVTYNLTQTQLDAIGPYCISSYYER